MKWAYYNGFHASKKGKNRAIRNPSRFWRSCGDAEKTLYGKL
jgi:hypothetical protein